MEKKMIATFTILLILLAGCIKTEYVEGNCGNPYFEYEKGKCCLDSNKNLLCDDEELKNEQEFIKQEEEQKKKEIGINELPKPEEKKEEPKEEESQALFLETTKKITTKAFTFYHKTYSGEEKRVDIITTIDETNYLYKKQKSETDIELKEYVDYYDPTIQDIAEQLLNKAIKLKEPDMIPMVVSFLGIFPFAESRSNGYDDYTKFPIETLMDEEGDSEDSSIFAAAILKAMGVDIILIQMEPETNLPKHMALAVLCKGCEGKAYNYDGKRYYHLETMNPTDLGKISSKYDDRSITMIKV